MHHSIFKSIYSLFELENTILRQLNLQSDQIADMGATTLFENTTLRQLNLEYSRIENIFIDKQLIKNS
jgi:hypothetical protein